MKKLIENNFYRVTKAVRMGTSEPVRGGGQRCGTVLIPAGEIVQFSMVTGPYLTIMSFVWNGRRVSYDSAVPVWKSLEWVCAPDQG